MKETILIRDMIYVSLMSVVIALCSWISVPSVIPFTMQTFALFCALLLLGGKRGFFLQKRALCDTFYTFENKGENTCPICAR